MRCRTREKRAASGLRDRVAEPRINVRTGTHGIQIAGITITTIQPAARLIMEHFKQTRSF